MGDNRLSEKFDALSDKAKESANKLRASAGREQDQLKADAAAARERATATADQFEEKVVDASSRASSQWDEVRGKWKAHVAKVRANIDAKKGELEAKAAARDADDAEGCALDAISFAQGAIEKAEVAPLDAFYAEGKRCGGQFLNFGHDYPQPLKAVAGTVEMEAAVRLTPAGRHLRQSRDSPPATHPVVSQGRSIQDTRRHSDCWRPLRTWTISSTVSIDESTVRQRMRGRSVL